MPAPATAATSERQTDGGRLNLRKLIRQRYGSLPENQRKAADYLLHNQRDIPFLSIEDLHARSGVSKATVVRLAQSLGLSGFRELRARLLEGVKRDMTPADRFQALVTTDNAGVLTLVAHQDVKNINQTINHLDGQTFHAVADLILKSSHVYTAGLGLSFLMSQLLAYSLNQVAVRASPLVHDYETFLEQVSFMTPRDVLIVFSFPPYSRETIELAKQAAARRVPVVAITDRLTSPVTFHAARILPIRSQNMIFTNSFSAISVVINALATAVVARTKGRAVTTLKAVNAMLVESGHFTDQPSPRWQEPQ
jgi:DNA-binding MurR/RpiR family transcriptional regulator